MNIHKRTRLTLLDRQKIYYLNKLQDLFSVSLKDRFHCFSKNVSLDSIMDYLHIN